MEARLKRTLQKHRDGETSFRQSTARQQAVIDDLRERVEVLTSVCEEEKTAGKTEHKARLQLQEELLGYQQTLSALRAELAEKTAAGEDWVERGKAQQNSLREAERRWSSFAVRGDGLVMVLCRCQEMRVERDSLGARVAHLEVRWGGALAWKSEDASRRRE